jgi:SWI/SNF-related matrix-associated actin-dependent regulator of chromatin subfamily E protein 1
VKAAHPDAKLWEIGKIIGQMWRDLNESDKLEYIGDYENAKADYCEQLKMYHNSPQYQSFLSSMTKKKTGKGYEDGVKGSPSIGSNALALNSNILNTMNASNKLLNAGVDMTCNYAIEPAEDEGIDDGLTMRHVCSARFNRNHRLLNEIFSEYVVPDSRSIVTSQRMEQLKKQVTSLELHQEKLKQELQSIEEKNEAKKRRFLSSSAEFQKEVAKFSEFKVSDEEAKMIFDKQYELLQKQWKEYSEKLVNEKVGFFIFFISIIYHLQ